MANVPYSMKKDQLARYDSEIDADKAQQIAQSRNTEHMYQKSYSPFAGVWLVAVHTLAGSRIGYIHPIID